jgi:hypothetical protein
LLTNDCRLHNNIANKRNNDDQNNQIELTSGYSPQLKNYFNSCQKELITKKSKTVGHKAKILPKTTTTIDNTISSKTVLTKLHKHSPKVKKTFCNRFLKNYHLNTSRLLLNSQEDYEKIAHACHSYLKKISDLSNTNNLFIPLNVDYQQQHRQNERINDKRGTNNRPRRLRKVLKKCSNLKQSYQECLYDNFRYHKCYKLNIDFMDFVKCYRHHYRHHNPNKSSQQISNKTIFMLAMLNNWNEFKRK